MTNQKSPDGIDIPRLSVIMPTYNRREILEKVLNKINTQQEVPADQMEVIVVDDCSTDQTGETLKRFAQQAVFPFHYKRLEENGGPARARNVALKMVRGDVVLIIGDDIIPESNLLKKHVDWHAEHPAIGDALLGHITWPEELRPTPFMRWLETGGRHYFFNYAAMREGVALDPIFFYTCNISIKRDLIKSTGFFDESFPFAAHEDLEYGYRLQAHGMRLYYDRKAVGYHWHPLDLRGVTRRIYLMGHSSVLFWKKAPDRASGMRRLCRRVIRNGIGLVPVSILVRHMICPGDGGNTRDTPWRWRFLLALAFWRGMHDGYKNITPWDFIAMCERSHAHRKDA